MKKLQLFLITVFVILFSGCAAANEDFEPQEINISIYSNTSYDFNQLSYIGESEPDFINQYSTITDDFDFMYNSIQRTSLTEEQKSSYHTLLLTLQSLHQKTTYDYDYILSLNVEEFKNLCTSNEITPTLTTIILFESFKELLLELENSANMNNNFVPKVEYFDYRIGRNISNEEVDALEHLQHLYAELYEITATTIDFSNMSSSDFITLLESQGFEETDYSSTKIDIAISILQEIK